MPGQTPHAGSLDEPARFKPQIAIFAASGRRGRCLARVAVLRDGTGVTMPCSRRNLWKPIFAPRTPVVPTTLAACMATTPLYSTSTKPIEVRRYKKWKTETKAKYNHVMVPLETQERDGGSSSRPAHGSFPAAPLRWSSLTLDGDKIKLLKIG
jgi:hypothetical protein